MLGAGKHRIKRNSPFYKSGVDIGGSSKESETGTFLKNLRQECYVYLWVIFEDIVFRVGNKKVHYLKCISICCV